MKRKELQGMKFGRLTVVEPVRTYRHKPNGRIEKDIKWLCTCDCGMTTLACSSDLTRGNKKSCGCLHREGNARTHGCSHKERLYDIWCAMKQRCNYAGYQHSKNYSMKGIKVCEEWEHDYAAFRKWSYEHGFYEQPKGTPHKEILSIDRIDSNKGYSPSNCQWISCDANLRRMNESRFGKKEVIV